MKKSDRPEDLTMSGGKMNRTGGALSPKQTQDMAEIAMSGPATDGSPGQLAALRREFAEEAEPIGTLPPPASLGGVVKTAVDAFKGKRSAVLLDKLAERLAFERSGTRLYQALLVKFDGDQPFAGGPTREQLVQIHNEEAQHFLMLKEAIEQLGGDPTAMTPCANLAGVESMGLVQVLTDPRTTLAEGLHAILIAEAADNEGWRLLVQLAHGAGHPNLAKLFERAMADEERHLVSVRSWVAEHARQVASVSGEQPKANGSNGAREARH